MKRRILLLCLIIALLSMVSLGTYAYYTTTQQTKNVITTGGIRFELLETGADGAAFPSAPMVILPGDVVSKTVRVENTGTHPMYLRIRLTPGVNDPALTADNCISLDINESDWTFADGYYYYNTALTPGETTTPLFTQVTFEGREVTNAYLGKTFSLDVAAFAVQSEHNGDNPLEAQGWPEH